MYLEWSGACYSLCISYVRRVRFYTPAQCSVSNAPLGMFVYIVLGLYTLQCLVAYNCTLLAINTAYLIRYNDIGSVNLAV